MSVIEALDYKIEQLEIENKKLKQAVEKLVRMYGHHSNWTHVQGTEFQAINKNDVDYKPHDKLYSQYKGGKLAREIAKELGIDI